MFGTNEIVGKKYFADAPKDSLFVTSVFFTLQGEGPYAGRPCVFVRLTKCQLDCKFCDTFFDQGDWFTYSELYTKIVDSVRSFAKSNEKVLNKFKTAEDKFNFGLVVTGGEPLLQSTPLSIFLESASKQFIWTQIETNGLVKLSDEELTRLQLAKTTIVCSPKCSEKNGSYLKPPNVTLDNADCLKFVLSADPLSYYHKVPDWAFDWRDTTNKTIYVSPMNVYNQLPQKAKIIRLQKKGEEAIFIEERSTIDEVISFWEPGLLNMAQNKLNHEYAGNYALKNGLQLSLQTHLLVSMA